MVTHQEIIAVFGGLFAVLIWGVVKLWWKNRR